MTEGDIAAVRQCLKTVRCERYFNAIVTRVLPDKWPPMNKADQLFLRATRLGCYLGGRVLLAGIAS